MSVSFVSGHWYATKTFFRLWLAKVRVPEPIFFLLRPTMHGMARRVGRRSMLRTRSCGLLRTVDLLCAVEMAAGADGLIALERFVQLYLTKIIASIFAAVAAILSAITTNGYRNKAFIPDTETGSYYFAGCSR